ncbi:MAG: hypothetical protein CL840_02750 [Crocinitomicaceae bacterium]|nr:hypothetical protein [Crocinitomicaceae bacterium]|tara:strand:+ start:1893 stop:2600 length:708 start_codon:yes stop_codon:yes gene_type:complete
MRIIINHGIRIWACAMLILLNIPNLQASKEAWDDCKKDWSKLMNAIHNHKSNKVNRLIKNGAEVNFYTPQVYCRWIINPIQVAIRSNNEYAIKALFKTGKLEVNRRHFEVACMYTSSVAVDLILSNGMNSEDTLNYGYTMAMRAAESGSIEVLEALLKYNPDVNQARHRDGVTPLMLAAKTGNSTVVKFLLEKGADKSAKDIQAKTAYDYIEDIRSSLNISEKEKNVLKNLLKLE